MKVQRAALILQSSMDITYSCRTAELFFFQYGTAYKYKAHDPAVSIHELSFNKRVEKMSDASSEKKSR